jgi:hypothetical protein
MNEQQAKDQQQKAEEAYYFKRFCELSGRAEVGTFTQPEPPAPDVLFHEGGKQIGVELTTSVTDKQARGVEEGVEKMVIHAKRRFEASGGPPLLVGISWKEDARPERAARKRIETALSELVNQHQPSIGCETELRWSEIPDSLQSFVYRVDIRRWPNLRHGLWQSPKATVVQQRRQDEITERLAAKDAKVTKYREHCDELWLLLYAEGNKHSSWWQLSDEAALKTYSSQFDRVFVLADFPRRVVELRLTRQAIPKHEVSTNY